LHLRQHRRGEKKAVKRLYNDFFESYAPRKKTSTGKRGEKMPRGKGEKSTKRKRFRGVRELESARVKGRGPWKVRMSLFGETPSFHTHDVWGAWEKLPTNKQEGHILVRVSNTLILPKLGFLNRGERGEGVEKRGCFRSKGSQSSHNWGREMGGRLGRLDS